MTLLDCELKWQVVRPIPVYVVLCRSVVFDSLQPHGLQPTRLLCWNFPGKNTFDRVAISYSRGSSRYLASPALAGGFFNAEPPGFVDPYPCQHTNMQ